MKKFAMFQQNYMIVLEMADNFGVSVLLTRTLTFVFVMKQNNLDPNSLQFVCIKTNFSSQIIKI